MTASFTTPIGVGYWCHTLCEHSSSSYSEELRTATTYQSATRLFTWTRSRTVGESDLQGATALFSDSGKKERPSWE